MAMQSRIWDLVPDELPRAVYKCPKCGKKTHFVNTKKFRINANKKKVDIWLIFQCIHCKSPKNLTLYERILPNEIPADELACFHSNDTVMAERCGFDLNFYHKNRIEMTAEHIHFTISQPLSEHELFQAAAEGIKVILYCHFPTAVRVEHFLSEQLQLSRTQVKKMIKDNRIVCTSGHGLKKIADGMELIIQPWQ